MARLLGIASKTALLGFCFLTLVYMALPTLMAQTQPQVINEVRNDVSIPLSELNPRAVNPAPKPAVSQWPPPATLTGTASSTMFGLNFGGIPGTGWLTSDTSAAVGATQYVQSVNAGFAVYDKSTGALLYGPVTMNTPWVGFGGDCETRNDGDPIVQYDKAAGRWILSRHTVPTGGPYLQCVAVSTTSDATGSYNRYAFPLTPDWPDYPKLGVWPDAYYISINRQDPTTFRGRGGLACALDRNSMLSGAPATAQCFQTGSADQVLLPSDLDGATPPPAGSPNYLLDLSGTTGLNLWKLHVDFVTPANSTFTGPIPILVPPYSLACNGGQCVPQLDTSQRVDGVGDRLMYRLAYRNFGTHESLVVNHSVGTLRSGIRWYEIRNPGGTPAVYQRGTFKPNDTSFRWLGSMGMDKVGDIAVGYSVSSSTMHPAISYTGRLPTDLLGTLESEATIVQGNGSQQPTNSQWNDVSSLSIDPVDDCTFWYTNQYYTADSTARWSTRVASFKFNGCH